MGYLMTVKQLRAFLAVAQTLSFTRACDRLHISQPALSLTIKGLEDSLGGPLLIRSTRRVSLTPEGEALVPLAKRLLADWDNTEERLRQHFTLELGKVAIAAMPSFACNGLPDALMAFRQHFPRINVTVHDVINEDVIEMVRRERVELGIAFAPEATDDLAFTPLFTDRFVAVVPPTSPLANATDISWSALLNEDLIALQRPSMVRRLLEHTLAARGIALPVAFESHQLATVGHMVASGLGVSVVPSLCGPQMQALGAHCLPLHDPVIAHEVGLLSPKDRKLSVAAQALADVLQRTVSTPVLCSK